MRVSIAEICKRKNLDFERIEKEWLEVAQVDQQLAFCLVFKEWIPKSEEVNFEWVNGSKAQQYAGFTRTKRHSLIHTFTHSLINSS